MEKLNAKMRKTMRDLHNKVGFIIVGLVVIYVISGVIQTYRDTSLLKHEVKNEKVIEAHLDADKLGKAIRARDLKIEKTEGAVQYFKDGTYNTETGEVKYVSKEWYGWVKSITELHKANSKGIVHYFTIIFAVALFFMCVSAFWMFKPGTKAFSSGVILTVVGIIASILLLLIN